MCIMKTRTKWGRPGTEANNYCVTVLCACDIRIIGDKEDRVLYTNNKIAFTIIIHSYIVNNVRLDRGLCILNIYVRVML